MLYGWHASCYLGAEYAEKVKLMLFMFRYEREVSLKIRKIGVIGAGAMGQGIAQIAAQAGINVYLYDVEPSIATQAVEQLKKIWLRQIERKRMSKEQVASALSYLEVVNNLEGIASADLVIEAIVEDLEVKRSVFRALERVVSNSCILASNTSSLSITEIAKACDKPSRVVGFHFFNPVPLMPVVEVIDGLRTDPKVCEALVKLSQKLGHTAVRAKDMPGFIVNHAGRAMNTEGLHIVQEGVATFPQVDAIVREQAGFRMGPFELMDLTGLDVSHPVMESIYHQFYQEPRFRPSPLTAVRFAGGLLGKKTGEGFYTYQNGQKLVQHEAEISPLDPNLKVWIAPYHELGYRRALNCVRQLGVEVISSSQPPKDALIIMTPFGEDLSTAILETSLDPMRTVALDTMFGLEKGRRRVLMSSLLSDKSWLDKAQALFASDGSPVTIISDSAGFVAQRLVAMIVNIAAGIAQQGIATAQDINIAASLGLGYPEGGPLAIGDKLGSELILKVLTEMQRITGDMRYRPSLWLKRRVQLGLPLGFENR